MGRPKKYHTEEERKAAIKKAAQERNYKTINVPPVVYTNVDLCRNVMEKKVRESTGLDIPFAMNKALDAILSQWLEANDPTGELRIKKGGERWDQETA